MSLFILLQPILIDTSKTIMYVIYVVSAVTFGLVLKYRRRAMSFFSVSGQQSSQPSRTTTILQHIVDHTLGGGGTILDRREFDKLMESGSRVIDFGRFLIPGLFDAPSRLKGEDLDKNGCLQGGDLDFKHFKMSNSPGSARRPSWWAK